MVKEFTSGLVPRMEGGHLCERLAVFDRAGEVVNYCYEDEDGFLRVGNGEYESQVNFCPFCGWMADVLIYDSPAFMMAIRA